MSVVIDNRERQLIDELVLKKVEHTVEEMDIGDIVFKDKEGNVNLVIERKTLADLAASIKDGRYREQKKRLLDSGNNIAYIIEGARSYYRGSMPFSTLQSSMTNCILRDGISIFRTLTMEETVETIQNISKQLEKYKVGEGSKLSYKEISSSTTSTVKKDNMTPQQCFINQLSVIPSVSSKSAIAISEQYGNIKSLLEALEQDINLVGNILMGGRKIGKKKAKTIKKFLIGD